MINFNPKDHSYTADDGTEFISVTQLLEQEFPFNAPKIAAKVSKSPGSQYYGENPKEIMEGWANAAALGTELHMVIADWITDRRSPTDKVLLTMLDKFTRIDFRGELDAEVRLWDPELRIAGTVDVVEVTKNEHPAFRLSDGTYEVHGYKIWDIKTSKKMEAGTLKKYSAQLEIYRRLAERTFSAEVAIGGILWFAQYATQRENTELHIISPEPCVTLVDRLFDSRRQEVRGKREHAALSSPEESSDLPPARKSSARGTVSRASDVSSPGSESVLDSEQDGEEDVP